MPTETSPVEVITDDDKQLIAIVQQNGLQAETAQNLQTSFAPLFTQARSIIEKSHSVTVTDVSQTTEIKMATLFRKELKAIRVTGEKLRKELKEESHKKGKAIDGFYNILDHLVSTEEARLTEQEKFAEIKEAQRKAALKTEREELLKPYGLDLTGYALGDMSSETFDQLLTGTKHVHEAKIEAARKAEADRIAKEAAEQAERIRIQVENERLRKEAEEKAAQLSAEREAAAKKEAELKRQAEEAAKVAAEIARKEREAIEAQAKKDREAAEEASRQERLKEQALREVERQKAETAAKEAQAKLDAERQAREKIEAEQKKARELEDARIAAENAAKQKAAAAPDKQKLLAFAQAIKSVQIPTLQTETGIALTATIKASHDKFVNWINDKAGAL